MARSAIARKMRKMQVPAYWPAFWGVHDSEYRGVLVAVKKAIAMPVCELMVEPIFMPSMPLIPSIPSMDVS
jgi:hypothetical protein